MIDSQRAITTDHRISNNREWNNCFIKNNQEISLDIAEFALQEPEDNLTIATSRAWYNCSYTMAAKPMKSLELHYTKIQFLIKKVILPRAKLNFGKYLYFTSTNLPDPVYCRHVNILFQPRQVT